MKFRIIAAIAASALSLCACDSVLKEEVFSQMDPDKMFSTEVGVQRILFSAYDFAAINGNFGGNIQFQEEWVCDQFWETGGAVNQQYMPMSQFTFTSSYPDHWTTLWNRFYKAVRDANIVLENLADSPLADDVKKLYEAEARFIRASVYYKGCTLWGGMILRTSTQDPSDTPRSTAEETYKFVEEEMLAAAEALPKDSGSSSYEYGRATKGAAYAYLCKLYLNTKQWQKCADMADKIFALGKYELWPNYSTLFKVENEMTNKEFIWVYPCSSKGTGNEMMCGAYPGSFASCKLGTEQETVVFLDNMRNWARMDRLWDSFYDSFDPADQRRTLIISEYVNTAGKTIQLHGDNNCRSFKYWPDVNANGNPSNNDIPVFRLADIILAKAEALNEIKGPNQETLDLIQQVRNRAGLTTPLSLSAYPTKEALRHRIMDERGWELYGECMRRQDLIREGTFLQVAQARLDRQYQSKLVLTEQHLLFPIPQTEVDASGVQQNPGW